MRLALARRGCMGGCSRSRGYGRAPAYGFVWSSDELAQRLNVVATAAKPFNTQVRASHATDLFKYNWGQWYLDFDSYMSSFFDSPKMFRLTHAMNLEDELTKYEAGFNLWQQQFVNQQKQVLQGPSLADTAKKRDDDAAKPGLNSPWAGLTKALDAVAKYVPLAAGAAALIYFGPALIRLIPTRSRSRS